MKFFFGACLTLFASGVCSPALAHVSPAWIDAPAYAPNIRLLIHESSAPGSKPSYVAVQRLDTHQAKVLNQIEQLKKKVTLIDDLVPHQCFHLERNDLNTHQTWCESTSHKIIVFVEGGSTRLKPNELLEVELQALEVR